MPYLLLMLMVGWLAVDIAFVVFMYWTKTR